MITKEIKLIGRQILDISLVIVDIIPTVEIGQTQQECFLIGSNLLSYIVSYNIASVLMDLSIARTLRNSSANLVLTCSKAVSR